MDLAGTGDSGRPIVNSATVALTALETRLKRRATVGHVALEGAPRE